MPKGIERPLSSDVSTGFIGPKSFSINELILLRKSFKKYHKQLKEMHDTTNLMDERKLFAGSRQMVLCVDLNCSMHLMAKNIKDIDDIINERSVEEQDKLLVDQIIETTTNLALNPE